MMRLFFRLVLWMSITVLSLQGGAAMAAGRLEQAAHATMAVSGHHCHEPAKQMAGAHCKQAGAKGAHASHAKCASCAGCCVGILALPVLPPGFQAPFLSVSVHAPPDAAMSSVVPATLDRPPRHSFV
jgi:hypothetical protein